MTRVILHGAVATAVGKSEWSVDIATPMEAVQAIDANCDGRLLQHFFENLESEYKVVVDNQPLAAIEEFTTLERPMGEVHILPVLRGAGNQGGWLVLVGVIIIALVLAIPTAGGSLFGTGSGFAALTSAKIALTATQSFFMTVGLAVTLAGVSQLLAPNQNVDNNEKPENKPSYIFNGAINMYKQGNPVPIGFGFTRTGSQVISAGIRAVDISQEE